MAQDVKTKDLPSASSLTGGEKVIMSQSGTTVQALLSVMYTFFETAFKTATLTLTNKRITKRVQVRNYDATLYPATDSYDCFEQKLISGTLTVGSPTGTPTNFQEIEFLLSDSGANQNISWDAASFHDLTGVMPTSTTTSKVTYVKFIYSTNATKWLCISSLTN